MLLALSSSIAVFLTCLAYYAFKSKLYLLRSTRAGSANNDAQLGSFSATKKEPNSTLESNTPLESDKTLYYFLQNLEQFPTALYAGRNRLISLLDETITAALETAPDDNSILSIPDYSPAAIYEFFRNSESQITERFDSYLLRRRQGGPREIFPNLEYAKWWLRTAAPVKYVDGAWLGGINRAFNSLPNNRSSQRIGWQILSEELGDGDLTKNHVWVYQELMRSIDADIGRGNERKFIDNCHNPNGEERVWKAAVSQLCLSLWPEEFLPEILGFNMAYESLPLHLLITIQELRELRLDPYYFILHVSIDNGHSGHAAMGIKAVTEYIESLPPNEVGIAWRRVQAGVILAEGLPTTPASPSELDCSVEKIFREKCFTARPMHAACPAKIGGKSGKSLSQWLETEAWVVRGSPEQKLVNPRPKSFMGAYSEFVGQSFSNASKQIFQDQIDKPPPISIPNVTEFSDLLSPTPISGATTPQSLFPILRLSAVPFEHLPSYPAKCATEQGMTAIKILRALYGFKDQNDLCAGMDEIHHSNENRGLYEISEHASVFRKHEGPIMEYLGWLQNVSKAPDQNYSFLLGAQLSFVVDLFWNEGLLEGGLLSESDINILRAIGDQCIKASREIYGLCDWNDLVMGFFRNRYEIGRCVVDAGGGKDAGSLEAMK
ncbi:uncharacterized protein H6S33_005760 [Morchella sextelata]|uniref:uncharacterized protein n=1 Tax=Morchella sextelata TaxID=1174677 RepID=UPI001D0474BF|nr:uncharacterized protein H6S33_005760 [Morchella sextelata]KAH0613874.1 hypothetical protein H6S33_005760 [Morchella sextelata]